MFNDRMEIPAIPERVYILCKLLEAGPQSSNTLKEKMEPTFLNQKTTYFEDYKKAAIELGLISSVDNLLTLSVSSDVIESMDSMRRYVNNKLSRYGNSLFYKVTKGYFKMGNSVFRGEQNVSNLGATFLEKFGIAVSVDGMRAWRFWVSFLGFGYFDKMFFIPNPNVYLQDIINESDLEKNVSYSINEFIRIIESHLDIIDGVNYSTHSLGYGFSTALRTLYELGCLKLEVTQDAKDIWQLFPTKLSKIGNNVTNITIL